MASNRLPTPESLEAKFKMLLRLSFQKGMKRKHAMVLALILDWFHSRYGDALASVRHIDALLKERDPTGRGLYMGDIHSAINDLVAWGFLHQKVGSGRAASRYVPVWDLVCVREIPNAKDANNSVREIPNADVREIPNATKPSVREIPNEDPSTPTRSQDPGTEWGDLTSGRAARAASGLSADAGGMPPEGLPPFEELWRAYGVRRNKVAAFAEYEKIAPDANQHAAMIEAASAWKEAAPSGMQRKTLEVWLREQRYDEDPPTRYSKPRQAAMPRLPRGAVRRDAWVEGVEGRLLDVRWNDANPGEDETTRIRCDPENLADLDVDDISELVGRRVLIDFLQDDGERWHRYPDDVRAAA